VIPGVPPYVSGGIVIAGLLASIALSSMYWFVVRRWFFT
jgi:hypothetical protein